MKKAAKRFSRYSEREWRAIVVVVALLSPRDRCIYMVGLRNTLEQLGRVYGSLQLEPDPLKFFAAREKQIIEFRRQVIEEGGLPPTLRQIGAEWLGAVEQLYHGLKLKSVEGGPNYTSARHKIPRAQNAQKAVLDCYFIFLLGVWVSIGGDLGPRTLGTKAIKAFIAACAQPVVEQSSAKPGAVSQRLYRLVKRGSTPHAVIRSWVQAWTNEACLTPVCRPKSRDR